VIEIRDLIKKAEKFLFTAEQALKIEDYDSCVSRCYYAMFFMAEAVLLTKDLSASSHKGVITLFGQYFIKTELFSKELGRAINDAYDKRLVGDYGIGFTVSESQAKELLETAQHFVTVLKDYLGEWV
jgi:uncharacterized protein (UPF0332 family)